MGRAARRRRRKQMEYLAGLASAEPTRFREAISKRLESRATLIAEGAGRIDTPVFPIVRQFAASLAEIAAGTSRTVAAEIKSATATLTDVCCHELSRHSGEAFRWTAWPKKK